MAAPAQPQTRTWLIAYDVRDKARLARLGRAAGKAALRLQDSLYAADLTEAGCRALAARFVALIDPEADDLRVYPVPDIPFGAWLGPDPETFDADAFLFGSGAERLVFELRRQNMNRKDTNNE